MKELTTGLIKEADGGKGFKSSKSSEGVSVAKARDASESMIKFTQSICTAVRGLSWEAIAPVHAVTTATTFTTSCSKQSKINKARWNKEEWREVK